MLRLAPVGTHASLMPTMSTAPTAPKSSWGTAKYPATGLPIASCPKGYVKQDDLCLSPGCIDGRSQCIVQDGQRYTCTYDQMMAMWQSSGVKRCPTPGSISPQESGQFITPSAQGSVPIPGTQPLPQGSPGSQPPPDGLPGQSTQPGVTITPDGALVSDVPPAGYYSIAGRLVPKWAVWAGGIAIGAGLFFKFRKH